MNSDRQARQRALEAARERLQRRRKQREHIQDLRRQKLQGITDKNDYGKKLVSDTKQLISDWKQSKSKQEIENKSQEKNSMSSISAQAIVPGIRADLSFVDSVNLVNINKRDTVEYVKEVQTNCIEIGQNANIINQKTSLKQMCNIMCTFVEKDHEPWPNVYQRKEKKRLEKEREILRSEEEEKGIHTSDDEEKANATTDDIKEEYDINILVMDESNADKLMANDDFMVAFKAKALCLEEALGVNNEHPIFIESRTSQRESKENEQMEKLTLVHILSFEKTNNRPITCLDFDSDGQRFLASYAGTHISWMNNQSQEEMDTPEGAIAVFDMKSYTTPVIELECQSMITNAQFHPSKHEMIIGTSVSGQVLGWDIRVKKTPVIRTMFSPECHSQPIFALNFLPSMSKIQQILTVSNDARICLWRDDILHTPFNSFTLKLEKNENVSHLASSQAKEITSTCLSFNSINSDEMYIGSDEGVLYRCDLNSKNLMNNDNEHIMISKQMNAHFGPITSVNFHPRLPIFLSSSFDWTCKLWHVSRDKPIAVFSQMQDYIYDCQWSPNHCSLFACGDGSGNLTLYDINHSIDQPIISESISKSKDVAITKVKFSPAGNHLIAGDSNGNISIYTMPSSLMESSDAYFQNLEQFVSRFLKQ